MYLIFSILKFRFKHKYTSMHKVFAGSLLYQGIWCIFKTILLLFKTAFNKEELHNRYHHFIFQNIYGYKSSNVLYAMILNEVSVIFKFILLPTFASILLKPRSKLIRMAQYQVIEKYLYPQFLLKCFFFSKMCQKNQKIITDKNKDKYKWLTKTV